MLLALLAVQAGCSRAHYFRQANEEAKCLIQEKSNDPRWALKKFSIDMDPRSRFYDPCDPICPPIPPDDPSAHTYMKCVDGKKGWPCWDKFGHRSELENPEWLKRLPEYAEINERGEIKLSLDTAVRISYVNSPTYQNQLETIYLSALVDYFVLWPHLGPTHKLTIEGRVEVGILPTGQVVGVIDALPTVAEVLEGIVREAEETLARLAA